MQGITDFIPTDQKIEYLNALLKVGFGRLDFGSFVSPKAIPQMQDTAKVLESLDESANTELIAIIANLRGATDACAFNRISFLGYPYSVSETFQHRNTNSNIESSFNELLRIKEVADKNGKEVMVYISMAFGNPYGDEYSGSVVMEHIDRLNHNGFSHFALADTVGLATPIGVAELVKQVINQFSNCDIGVHLHCRPDNWHDKVDAAFQAGCRNFDSAIGGFGGCPMAGDSLVGNLSTELLIQYLTDKHVSIGLNMDELNKARKISSTIFS
jgi:hydroxymethylglutaryl-CoA lyase